MKAIPGSPGRGGSRNVARAFPIALASIFLVQLATGQNVKLNAPLRHFTQGGVLESRTSPDGRWCVYRATEGSQVAGLFSVRADGSESSRRLVPEGMDVEHFGDFEVSAELAVVESQSNLFLVPIDASRPPAPILPWNPLRIIEEFAISPDGSRVVYLERSESSKNTLYSADIQSDEPPVQLNAVVPAGDIRRFEISPDSGHVVFVSDQDVGGVTQVLGVPIDGSSEPVDLTPPAVLSGRNLFTLRISPDSARVVYTIDQNRRSDWELFSAPIDGSSGAVKLNSPLFFSRAVAQWQISANGRRVVYIADQEANDVFEIFSVPIDGSAAPVKLNAPLVPGTDVAFGFEISPNSRIVSFIARHSASEAALWVAPISGRFPAIPVQADPMDIGRFTPDSRQLVVRVRDGAGPIDLFSVHIGHGGTRNLTQTSGEGLWLFEFLITPDGASAVYVESRSGSTDLLRVPVTGETPPVVLCSFWSRESLELTADGRFVLFRGELTPSSNDVHQLFSVPVDGHRDLLALNGPLVTDHIVGDVSSLEVSAQGSVAFAVYVPDRGSDGDNDYMELFSVTPGIDPLPIRLTPDAPFERDISAYAFDAGGQRIVFEAGGGEEVYDLFSVPVDGHAAPLQLDDATHEELGDFVLAPDGPFAVFDADVGFWSELFRVALDGGPQISLSGPLVFSGSIRSFQVAPGSGRVVYVADQLAFDRYELFSVPSDASALPVRLHGPLPAGADVDVQFLIHPDGSTVLALGELLANDVRELFRIPVDGSAAPARLSAPLVAGGNVERGFRIGPDGNTVVYLADQEEDERFELYAVPLDGSAAPVELSGALVPGGDVQPDFVFTPDGNAVVYRADAETDEQLELFRAALDGATLPVKLNPALVPEGDVRAGFLVTPDSRRVLFRADRSADERIELFSALLDGGGSLTLNGDLAPGGQVADLVRLAVDGRRIFFVADQTTDEVRELFVAPVDQEKAARVLSGPFLPGSDVSAVEPTSDGKGILYLADQETDGVVELFLSVLAPSFRPMRTVEPR